MASDKILSLIPNNTILPKSTKLPSQDKLMETAPSLMPVRQRPSPEEGAEIARLGWELYETKVRAQVEPENLDRFIVIDVDTEEFAIADTHIEAATQLITKNVKARLYGTRVGSKAMYKL